MAWKHALALLIITVIAAGCVTTPAKPGARPAEPAGAGNMTPPQEAAPEVPERTAPAGTIVAFGDSLTAGYGVDASESYPAQLERMLKEEGYNYTVINMGKNGDTAAGALARVDSVIDADPDIVILAIGANDALRMADPAATKATIGSIIARLKAENITVVLAGSPQVAIQGWSYPGDFTRIYGELAAERETIYNPFFLKGVAGDARLNLPDRAHPNAAGYAIIARNMYPYTQQAIASRT